MNQSTTSRRSFLRSTAALCAGAAVSSFASPAARSAEKPLNVVVFLVDDLGWTDVGCFNAQLYLTPNIDRLASQGMKFTQAYASCTVCSPTRASLLTGQYPARLHLTDWIAGHKRPWAKLRVPDFNLHLPHEAVTIAEALKPHGYTSASIGKWHLGGDGYLPETQGFDLNVAGTEKGQPPRYFSPYNIPTLENGPDGENLTDRMAAEACKFIESNANNPFFLYLPFFAVHTPIQGKKDYTEKYRKLIQPGMDQKNPEYAAMVNSVDDAVGRVLDELDRHGLADNTLILFTGDNGGLIPVTSNLPLRDGKGSAYEGGVREPMIVRWPGKVRPGSVCDTPAISADFFPTILDALNIPIPEEAKPSIDGVSLLPLLRESGTIEREALFWHYPHYHPGGATPYSAIRRGDWRLIEFFEDGHLELYNLHDDIGESYDLASQQPAIRDELHRMLIDWRKKVDAQMPTLNPDYKPEWAGDSAGAHK
ncbi:MAG: sulfatase-like hydrolase/transferase [bacterium]|nr:sulfatase-like hydrolase/transferase [bacterium]